VWVKKQLSGIILELGDKIGEIPVIPGEETSTDIDTDVISALMNLGYKKIELYQCTEKNQTQTLKVLKSVSEKA